MKVSMSQKILGFAKDRNDFFCTHELGSFFNDYDFKKLSAIVGKLKQDRKLTMTDVTEPCKMQTKKHHFYIFNKRQNETPKIDEDGEDRKNKPEISKKRKEVFDIIKESVLKQTGEFCRHMIAKETNISAKNVAPYLKQLRKKRKLKYIGKKDCPEGLRTHKFYILVNKNIKNEKLRHENTRTKITQYQKWKDRITEIKKMMENGKTDKEIGDSYGSTRKAIENIRQRNKLFRTSRTVKIIQKPIKIEKIEGDLGIFVHCLSCGIEYVTERESVMKEKRTECPRCSHVIRIGD